MHSLRHPFRVWRIRHEYRRAHAPPAPGSRCEPSRYPWSQSLRGQEVQPGTVRRWANSILPTQAVGGWASERGFRLTHHREYEILAGGTIPLLARVTAYCTSRPMAWGHFPADSVVRSGSRTGQIPRCTIRCRPLCHLTAVAIKQLEDYLIQSTSVFDSVGIEKFVGLNMNQYVRLVTSIVFSHAALQHSGALERSADP